MKQEFAEKFIRHVPKSSYEWWVWLLKKNHDYVMEILNLLGEDILKIDSDTLCYALKQNLSYEQILVLVSRKFTVEQMCEICEGFKHNLSVEKIKIYAKRKFDASQMEEIRKGLENKLSLSAISIFAKKEFNSYQMTVIREALEKGLKRKQILIFANPFFNACQMEEIKLGFEHDLTTDQVLMYAKLEDNFSYGQMMEIRYGLENGLDEEKIKRYAKKNYDSHTMRIIRLIFEKDYDEKYINLVKPENTIYDNLNILARLNEYENVEKELLERLTD